MQEEHYWSEQDGWQASAQKARFRLVASSLERFVCDGRNLFYERDPGGGWQLVENESELAGFERGLYWESWPVLIAGERYRAFNGLRVVDQEIAVALEGLVVRDREGRRLVEPQEAGSLFLLSEEDAHRFAERAVRELGGRIARGSAIPARAPQLLTELEQALAELERIRRSDERALADVRSGIVLAGLEFDAQTERWLVLVRDARELARELRLVLAELLALAASKTQRLEAAALVARARAATTRIDALNENRERDGVELAIAGAREQRLAPPPADLRLPAFREIGRVAASRGYPVVPTDDGCRIRLGNGWLVLGGDDGFAIELDNRDGVEARCSDRSEPATGAQVKTRPSLPD